MISKTVKTLVVALAASAFSLPAGATAFNLAADGQWQTFDVDSIAASSGGLEWIDAQSASGYNNDGSALHFVFNLLDSAFLTVVDGGFAGDRFEIFDNGVQLGFTSVPANSYPNSWGTNFDAALADSNYSNGIFTLGAGQHDITGLLFASASAGGVPFDATVGAVSLAPTSGLTAVPVPGALGLFLAGSGLLGVFSRRRAN